MTQNSNDQLQNPQYLTSLFEKIESNNMIPKKDKMDEIIERLDSIEKGIKGLTGPQLINGIWR